MPYHRAQMTLDDRRIAEWLFLLSIAVYAFFYAGAGWNQNATFDLTRAIVEQRTLAIDRYASNTGDVSRHAGHVYANKAPALSFAAVIPYAALYAIEKRAGVAAADPRVIALNCYFSTVLVVGLLAALVPALVYLEGRRRGFGATWTAGVALLVAFGTLQFPYATLLMVHVPSGALMLLALRIRRGALAGLCAGLAGAMNYVALPAILFFALVRRGRAALAFLLAAAVPCLALAAYQFACFGSPLTTSVETTDPRFLTHGAVLGVLGRPSLEALFGITISPYRGLFFFCPLLLAAVAGFVHWWRDASSHGELAAVAGVSLVFFAFNVSFNGWEGGFATGARYLVPLIPLWAAPLLHVRPRWLVVVLGVVSCAIAFTATAVDPQPSGTIPRPLTEYQIPLLLRGRFSPDVPITAPWSAATFRGHTSVNRMAHDEAVVFSRHLPGSVVSEWSSFNLGEPYFGAGDPRSLIPVLLLGAGGAAAILGKARRVRSA